MTISAWASLALTIPVLLLGEALVARIRLLARFNIPVPVAGGLTVAAAVLGLRLIGGIPVTWSLDVSARWWTFWILPETVLLTEPAPSRPVYLPFMIMFFTCIGLNADGRLIRRGGWPLVAFLGLTTAMAIVQAVVGVSVATVLDAVFSLPGSPALLGLICGPISMTGGHGTSGAFSPDVAQAGLAGATTIGVAAATFGLVAGGLIGGPIGTLLIRRRRLARDQDTFATPSEHRMGPTYVSELRTLLAGGGSAAAHVLVVLLCMKAGAWLGDFIASIEVGGGSLKFPVYIGSMIVGIVFRNGWTAMTGRRLSSETIARIMFAALGVFLAVSMMSLDLFELAAVAVPMLLILGAQVVTMALFALTVTFRLMGGDYEAAVIAGGHCGSGLGATPNAVANMESLVKSFGPAPKAFLIVPIVGAFLIDFTNAIVITVALNLV